MKPNTLYTTTYKYGSLGLTERIHKCYSNGNGTLKFSMHNREQNQKHETLQRKPNVSISILGELHTQDLSLMLLAPSNRNQLLYIHTSSSTFVLRDLVDFLVGSAAYLRGLVISHESLFNPLWTTLPECKRSFPSNTCPNYERGRCYAWHHQCRCRFWFRLCGHCLVCISEGRFGTKGIRIDLRGYSQGLTASPRTP